MSSRCVGAATTVGRQLCSLAMLETISVDDFTLTAALPDADESGLPPVLLVHGLFVGPWCFETILTQLASRGFPAYAVALSGRAGGRPSTNVGRLSLSDFADDARDALAWIRARHKRPPALLGHSMGGLVAQMVAAREEVAALVLLAPAPPRGIPLINPRLFFAQLTNLPKIIGCRPLTPTLEEMASLSMNRVPADQHATLFPKFEPDSGLAAREISFGAISVNEDSVKAPVLCATGNDDRLVPPAVTRRVAARYHAPVWEYRDHGHFFIVEPGMERLADDIALWLRHVALMQEHPARVEDLWLSLQGSIGDVVDLTWFDGRIVRAEMVNVDLAVRRSVVYRLLENRRPGTVPAPRTEVGAVARAALHELAAVVPAVAS